MKIIILTFTFLLIIQNSLLSQNDTLFQDEFFAIYPKAGVLFNFYNADFSSFQNAVDCGIFTSGNGFGISGALFLEKALNENIQIGIGGEYIIRSGKLSVNNTFQSRDLNNNQIVNVTAENYIETNLAFLEIIPDIKYMISKDLINGPFRFNAGLRLGLPVSKSFIQKEKIVSPDNAVFVNAGGVRTQSRDIADGDISTLNSIHLGIRAGLENMLKIGGGHYFTQTLSFDYNFGNATTDANWNIYSINLSLGFRFSVKNPKSEPEPEIKYEQIEEEKPKELEIVIVETPKEPVINLSIDGMEDFKVETGNELLATLPLVNAVFFMQNSSELPLFYSRNQPSDNNFYYGDAVLAHKYVLYRIAEILKTNSNSSVLLQSSTSGDDEAGGIELSKQRAKTVKDYLINLGVNEDKIKINALTLPKNPTNQDYTEGREENRRVELLVQNAPLQEYVDILKYSELSGKVNFSLSTENISQNKTVTVSENINNQSQEINKDGNYIFPIKKRIEESQTNLPVALTATYDDLVVKKENNLEISSLDHKNIELELDNFLAILMFEFNSSELSEDNKALLKQLSDKLPNNSTIEIIGSADIIGTNEYNLELAKQRALNTEKYINSVSRNKFKIITNTNIDKFDDGTPQGRFLNRSIKIRVK